MTDSITQVTPGCDRCRNFFKDTVFICRRKAGKKGCDKCLREHMVCSLVPPLPKKSKAPAKSKRPREEESTSEAPNDEDPAVNEAPRPKRKASSKSPIFSYLLKTDTCCPLGRLTLKVKAPPKASSSKLPRKCSYVLFPISDLPM